MSNFLNFLQYCNMYKDAMQRAKSHQKNLEAKIAGRGLRTVVSSKPTQAKLLQGCRYLTYTLPQMFTFCSFSITSFSPNSSV